MKTDDLQLLRGFRAEIPAPSEETRRRIYAHATSGKSGTLRAFGRRPRRRRLAMMLAALACAGVAIAAGFGAFEGTPPPPGVAREFQLTHLVASTATQAEFKKWRHVDPSKARGVIEVLTADGPEDLWAAPADNGGQCYLIDWSKDYAGANGVLSIQDCTQSHAPPSNLDFSDVWAWTHPNFQTVFGSVYVPATTARLTLGDGSTVKVPVVENLFIDSLPRGTRVQKVAAFDKNGNQVAEATRARHLLGPPSRAYHTQIARIGNELAAAQHAFTRGESSATTVPRLVRALSVLAGAEKRIQDEAAGLKPPWDAEKANAALVKALRDRVATSHAFIARIQGMASIKAADAYVNTTNDKSRGELLLALLRLEHLRYCKSGCGG
jgi:hypothetical protein